MGKLGDALTNFDWITAAVSLVLDASGSVVIGVTDDVGNLTKLRKAGVRVSRVQWNNHKKCYMFDVPIDQAERAARVLGVTLQ